MRTFRRFFPKIFLFFDLPQYSNRFDYIRDRRCAIYFNNQKNHCISSLTAVDYLRQTIEHQLSYDATHSTEVGFLVIAICVNVCYVFNENLLLDKNALKFSFDRSSGRDGIHCIYFLHTTLLNLSDVLNQISRWCFVRVFSLWLCSMP